MGSEMCIRDRRNKDSDPKKTLEELYSDQKGVLNIILEARTSISSQTAILGSAVNKLYFYNLAMDKSIKDDADMVAFVDRSLTTCNQLITK